MGQVYGIAPKRLLDETSEYARFLDNLSKLKAIKNPDKLTADLIERGNAIGDFENNLRLYAFKLIQDKKLASDKIVLSYIGSELMAIAGMVPLLAAETGRARLWNSKPFDFGYNWKDLWALITGKDITESFTEPQIEMLDKVTIALKEFAAATKKLYVAYSGLAEAILKGDRKGIEGATANFESVREQVKGRYDKISELDEIYKDYKTQLKDYDPIFTICAKFMVSVALIPIGGGIAKGAGKIAQGAIAKSGMLEDAAPWVVKLAGRAAGQLTPEAIGINTAFVLAYNDNVKEKYGQWLSGKADFSNFMATLGIDWAKMTASMMAFDFAILGISKVFKPLWEIARGIRVELMEFIEQAALEPTEGIVTILEGRGLKVEGKGYLLDEIRAIARDGNVRWAEVYTRLGGWKTLGKMDKELAEEIAAFVRKDWAERITPRMKEMFGAKLGQRMIEGFDRFFEGLAEKNAAYGPLANAWNRIPTAQKGVLIAGAFAVPIVPGYVQTLRMIGRSAGYRDEIANEMRMAELDQIFVANYLFPETKITHITADRDNPMKIAVDEKLLAKELKLKRIITDPIGYLMREVVSIHDSGMGNQNLKERLERLEPDRKEDIYNRAVEYLQIKGIRG